MAGLTLLRDAGKLSRLPLGITLISPAVDMSNASVFGSREPVSSHFEQQQHHGQQQFDQHNSNGQHSHCSGSCSSSTTGITSSGGGAGADAGGGERCMPRPSAGKRSYQEAHGGPLSDSSMAGQLGAEQQEQEEETVQPSPAPSVSQLLLGDSFRRRRSTHQQQPQHTQQQSHPKDNSSHTPLEPQGSFNVAEQQLEQQHVPLQHQPSVDCKMHAAHTAGGRLRPRRLASGLFSEAMTALRVHVSSSSAAQGAATGWFDYIPSDSFADELHCYLAVRGSLVGVIRGESMGWLQCARATLHVCT